MPSAKRIPARQAAIEPIGKHRARHRIGGMVALLAFLLLPSVLSAVRIPIIDAHSQIDHKVRRSKVIALMDKAGVVHTILSTRGKVTPEELIAFAADNPGRITPALRTKGKFYGDDSPVYYELVEKQLGMPQFGAIAEVLLWHAEKFNKRGDSVAPKWVVPFNDRRVRVALKGALSKGWPFIIHIEFGEAGADREEFMAAMEATLRKHSGHQFGLIHMGQLDAKETRRLVEAHPNLFFLTSHANTVVVKAQKRHPWSNMFKGRQLAPDWEAVVTRYPKQFVMAFDNVFPQHWGKYYIKQVRLWRKALARLPVETAHDLAHRNAERLWGIAPVK